MCERKSQAAKYLTLAVALAGQACNPLSSDVTQSVAGVVVDDQGPVANARVRVQTTEHSVMSDEDGRFIFEAISTAPPFSLTAWAPGYFNTGGSPITPGEDVVLTLTKHAETDNVGYQFSSAYAVNKGKNACEPCHSRLDSSEPELPFDQWVKDAHSQSATNPRFLTMFYGTDTLGNQSSATQFHYQKEYGRIPLPRDPNEAYYGPGFKLDFPDSSGNCAACHLPTMAINNAYGADPASAQGVEKEGATCDFCHKVWDVELDSESGLPRVNAPGVLSFQYRRPPPGEDFFAAQFDDVAPGKDTFVAVYEKSAYCAPCHFAKFGGVQVYNSFGEWLASPYSDPQKGQTCQQCHMPTTEADHFALPDVGGLRRDPARIASHLMLGSRDKTFMADAVALKATAARQDSNIQVTVSLTNEKAGHHFPTGSPLRQLILLVESRDASGQALQQLSGPVLPSWCGEGDPAQGNYAGLAGQVYARILADVWTGKYPSASYWNPVRVVQDNRLPARGSDLVTFSFATKTASPTTVKVRLIYRRAFRQISLLKKWDVPDTTLKEFAVQID